MAHFKADFAALSTHHASDGWSIVSPGAMTAYFIGPPAGWILRIMVFAPFLTRILVHLIRLRHLIAERRGGKTLLYQLLNGMPSFQKVGAINAQFLG
jgi:hypothetical protein